MPTTTYCLMVRSRHPGTYDNKEKGQGERRRPIYKRVRLPRYHREWLHTGREIDTDGQPKKVHGRYVYGLSISWTTRGGPLDVFYDSLAPINHQELDPPESFHLDKLNDKPINLCRKDAEPERMGRTRELVGHKITYPRKRTNPRRGLRATKAHPVQDPHPGDSPMYRYTPKIVIVKPRNSWV